MEDRGFEYIAGWDGIINKNMLKGSPSGPVITYTLSEEERLKLIEQYGPPLSRKVNSVTILRKSLA